MTKILKNMMQDAMEFTWPNARNFYEMAGILVEKKCMQWSDANRLHEMRMTYARTVFPAPREEKEAPKS